MKDSNRIDDEDFDYQKPTTLEDIEYTLNRKIDELEYKYYGYDFRKVSWFYDMFINYIPKELLAAYIIREIIETEPDDNGEVEIKHIDNMSDDLSERIKKYKPIVVELDKLDKRMSKSLRIENKLFIIDSQFASFLGQELGELLTGTKAREARRNVDSFDEINEVLAFLYDVSCIDWERLSIDLQNNHSAKQPIKWTQIKSNLVEQLKKSITNLYLTKYDDARIDKLSTFIINNIITDSSIMTQIRSNQYYADLSAIRKSKCNPVPKEKRVINYDDRINHILPPPIGKITPAPQRIRGNGFHRGRVKTMRSILFPNIPHLPY